MGVGAIFISTLAASKLPPPNNPPQTKLDILTLSIQPITYFVVLSSILVHGLTIGFFSLGRRVHSRVQSISRTFTQASVGGDEPSWMSRVKRVAAGEDIVINRDDDDEKVDLEKGQREKGDLKDTGKLAMFAVPTSSSKTASTSSDGKDEKEEKVERTEREMESDDHPPENILSEDPKERDSHEDGIKRVDTHYSTPPKIDLLGNKDDHHVSFFFPFFVVWVLIRWCDRLSLITKRTTTCTFTTSIPHRTQSPSPKSIRRNLSSQSLIPRSPPSSKPTRIRRASQRSRRSRAG